MMTHRYRKISEMNIKLYQVDLVCASDEIDAWPHIYTTIYLGMFDSIVEIYALSLYIFMANYCAKLLLIFKINNDDMNLTNS